MPTERPIHRVDPCDSALAEAEIFTATMEAIPTSDVLRSPKLMVHYAAKAEDKLSLGLVCSMADYSDMNAKPDSVPETGAPGCDGATS